MPPTALETALVAESAVLVTAWGAVVTVFATDEAALAAVFAAAVTGAGSAAGCV
jgi:hypothetical protein